MTDIDDKMLAAIAKEVSSSVYHSGWNQGFKDGMKKGRDVMTYSTFVYVWMISVVGVGLVMAAFGYHIALAMEYRP